MKWEGMNINPEATKWTKWSKEEEMKINSAAKAIVDAIFSDRTKLTYGGVTVQRKLFASGKVRGFDIGDWRWVEQNPNKGSQYAKMARDGAQIVWVIDHKTNYWKGLIINGIMHKKDKAKGWVAIGQI